MGRFKPLHLLEYGLAFALAGLFLLAFMKSYIRTEATLIGYRLGELKGKEASLLEQRSSLRSELAKLTTKENLLKLSQ